MVLGTESQRHGAAMPPNPNIADAANHPKKGTATQSLTLHPEMLDENGQPIREPLLVMKSMTVDDARDRLDALFQDSPDHPGQEPE